MWNRKSNKNKR
jgi:hypothetical protein